MTTPSRICLCGFMGAGKSLVGPALAMRLHYTFIDLDSEIAAEYGQTIHEIFKTAGEAAFRKSESEYARRLLDRTQMVMALGAPRATATYRNPHGRGIAKAMSAFGWCKGHQQATVRAGAV